MAEPRRLAGLLLIALGLLWTVAYLTGAGGTVIVPAIGIAFLVSYLATRSYGLLIPGGILTGLGTGLVIEAQGGPGAAVVLGLGLGFTAITVVDLLVGDGRGAWWWPLIPGGILTVVGGSQLAGVHDIGAYLVPLALIVVGGILLLKRSSPESADRQDPDIAAEPDREEPPPPSVRPPPPGPPPHG